MPEVILYYRSYCPFCNKVFGYLKDNGISVPTKEITTDPKNLDELIAIGGKQQAPCLVMNGKALYESDDIIEWFKNNWKDNR